MPQSQNSAGSGVSSQARDKSHIALNFCANALDLAIGARVAYSQDEPPRQERHAGYGEAPPNEIDTTRMKKAASERKSLNVRSVT